MTVINLLAKVDPATSSVQPELDLGLPPKLIVRRSKRSGTTSEAMESVAEFHVAFNLPVQNIPRGKISDELGALRVELLREEFEEFADAVSRSDIVAIADALADVVYVAYGAAITYGINLDAVIREVHRANMSKLGPDGRPIMRDDGKVLKSDSYVRPDVNRVLMDQPPLFLD